MQLLILTGSMGAGKTTALGEISDLLSRRGIAHAAIDADALDGGYFPEGKPRDLMQRNLAAVWSSYAALGIRRLVIAYAVEGASEIHQIRDAVHANTVTTVRLTAHLETMRQRVAVRRNRQSR